MTDYLDRQIAYYKVKIALEKNENPSIDPLNLFPLKINQIHSNLHNGEHDFTTPNFTRPFTAYSYDNFLSYDSGAIEEAYNDIYKSFSGYYLPIMLITEAYKSEGRRDFLGKPGMYDKIYDTPEMVVYNDYLGKKHIGLKGTNNYGDLMRDAFLAFTGQGFMGNVENDFKKIVEKYPNDKFNIYSHSLGSSQASILLDNYGEKINHVVAFNMGTSGFPTGFKPKDNPKLLHYHIVDDKISGYAPLTNTIKLKQRGQPIGKRSKATPEEEEQGIRKQIDNYHKLKNFIINQGDGSKKTSIPRYIDRLFKLNYGDDYIKKMVEQTRKDEEKRSIAFMRRQKKKRQEKQDF